MLLAWILDFSVNDDAPLFAEVIELGAEDFGKGYQRTVIFSLLGGGVWPLDAHSLKGLTLIWNTKTEAVNMGECHTKMTMANSLIIMPGAAGDVEVISPPLL